MAYCSCDTRYLRDAILRVHTPHLGARTLTEFIGCTSEKIYNLYGYGVFGRAMLRENLPFYPSFPSMTDYSDDKPPFEFDKGILSGSWSEGLYFYGLKNVKIPDMDFMLVLKNISFSQQSQHSGNLTLKEDTPFVDVHLTHEEDVKMWNNFLVEDDAYDPPGRRLSSTKLKEKLHENHKKFISISGCDNSNDIDDGASVYIDRMPYHHLTLNNTLKFMNNIFPDHTVVFGLKEITDFVKISMKFTGWDIVLAISCDGWPSSAKEWITRHRIWPYDDLVQKIIESGFHIVPKRSTEGDFRLSFSCAETTLIRNLTELQHKVLRSFKAVVKYHQNTWSPSTKEILTTYHLKTVAFWHFEKVAQDSFTEDTVVTHLLLLFQELAEALRTRQLPLYFMPKVNLFKNIENPEEAFDIADKIEQLSSDILQLIEPLENITSCIGQFSNLAINIKEKVVDLKGRLQKNETNEPSN